MYINVLSLDAVPTWEDLKSRTLLQSCRRPQTPQRRSGDDGVTMETSPVLSVCSFVCLSVCPRSLSVCRYVSYNEVELLWWQRNISLVELNLSGRSQRTRVWRLNKKCRWQAGLWANGRKEKSRKYLSPHRFHPKYTEHLVPGTKRFHRVLKIQSCM